MKKSNGKMIRKLLRREGRWKKPESSAISTRTGAWLTSPGVVRMGHPPSPHCPSLPGANRKEEGITIHKWRMIMRMNGDGGVIKRRLPADSPLHHLEARGDEPVVMSPWRPPARVPLHVTALGSLTPFNCRLWSHRRVNTCFRQHRRSSLSLSVILASSSVYHLPSITCVFHCLPLPLPPSSLLPSSLAFHASPAAGRIGQFQSLIQVPIGIHNPSRFTAAISPFLVSVPVFIINSLNRSNTHTHTKETEGVKFHF